MIPFISRNTLRELLLVGRDYPSDALRVQANYSSQVPGTLANIGCKLQAALEQYQRKRSPRK